MSLKHKKKVYLSLNKELIEFVEEQSCKLNTTKSKFMTSLLLKEYENNQRKKIDKILEGTDSNLKDL
jgi:hypothetical protein